MARSKPCSMAQEKKPIPKKIIKVETGRKDGKDRPRLSWEKNDLRSDLKNFNLNFKVTEQIAQDKQTDRQKWRVVPAQCAGKD